MPCFQFLRIFEFEIGVKSLVNKSRSIIRITKKIFRFAFVFCVIPLIRPPIKNFYENDDFTVANRDKNVRWMRMTGVKRGEGVGSKNITLKEIKNHAV